MGFNYTGIDAAIAASGLQYGFARKEGERYGPRVTGLLEMLAMRLQTQQEAGSPYYVGTSLTAVDIYSAAFMALFSTLPQDQCEIDPANRTAFETLDEPTRKALNPILLKHRDMMYVPHLQLPLVL